MKLDTRAVMRRAAAKTSLTESKTREVFRSIMSIGTAALMEGEVFSLPGVGQLFVDIEEDELILKVKTTPQFDSRMKTSFVENRNVAL